VSKLLKLNATDRKIITVSLPLFGQMVIAPIMVLCDTAIVGHLLSTTDLAGMAIGASIANAVIGTFIFILFVTNAAVSRAFGAKKKKEGIRFGINSIYLGLIIGILIFGLLFFLAPSLVNAYHQATPGVRASAAQYLRGFIIGAPAIMTVMSCSGILRGLQRLRLPMYVAIIGLLINVPLNLCNVLVFKMGIFGSGLATSITQYLMAAALLTKVLYEAKKVGARKRFSLGGAFVALKEGVPVLIRTVALWSALTLFVYFVSSFGEHASAGMQIVDSVWLFVEFVVDAIAQAVTILVGAKLGEKDFESAKYILRRAVRIGLFISVLAGVFLISGAFYLPQLFTPDPGVHQYALIGLFETGFIYWYAGFAFIMDGALLASNDTVFMAKMTIIGFVLFLVSAIALEQVVPKTPLGFVLILASFDVVMLFTRAVLCYRRWKSDQWLGKVMVNNAPGLS
jgi:putative MATE family efflux protein